MERRTFMLGLLASAIVSTTAAAAPKWDLQRGPHEPRRRWWQLGRRRPNRWGPTAPNPPYGGPTWGYGTTVPPRRERRCGFWGC